MFENLLWPEFTNIELLINIYLIKFLNILEHKYLDTGINIKLQDILGINTLFFNKIYVFSNKQC